MKKIHIVLPSALFALVLAVTGGLVVKSVHAATGTIYLSPASQSVQSGNNFSVALRVNPGTAIDTVNAYVGYDSSQVSLVGVDCSGSPFTAFPSCPTSGNPVNLTAADLSGSVSSDSFVATFTFKATAASGSASLTLSGDTATGGNPNGATAVGASVTITAVPSGGGSSGGGSSGGGSSGSGSGSSSGGTPKPSSGGSSKPATPTPTTPTPSDDTHVTVNKQEVQFTKAVFTAITTAPAQVYCQFGSTKDALTQQTAPDALGTTHQIAFDPSALLPGHTYYYVVVSKDASGKITQSEVKSFKTKGLSVTIGVFDKNHKPVKHKTVTLHSDPTTTTTDGNGVATFSDIAPGDHHVVYTSGGKSYDQEVSIANNVKTVADVQTAAVQNIAVIYGFAQSSSAMAVRAVTIAVLVLFAGAGFLAYTRRKVRFAAPTGAPLSMDPVVVGGASPSLPNFHSEHTPASQETAQRLSNIPEPNQPSPGSTVEPLGGEHKEI